MRNILVFAAVALLMAVVAPKFVDRLGAKGAAQAPAPAAAPAPANALAVPSGRDGHFRLDASVGGRRVAFLVDTGATIVALTANDAERLGLHPAPRDFTAQIQTANGIVRGAPVRLASLSLGALRVEDVAAVVMPEGALAENLLGMSFLSRLRRFEFRGRQLLLEQ